MATPAVEAPVLPAVPLDVLEFAVKHNAVQYLQPLLAMTREIFPRESLTLALEEDAEIADCYTIAIQIDVTGWNADKMLAARTSWTQQIFEISPATEVWLFRIRMVRTGSIRKAQSTRV